MDQENHHHQQTLLLLPSNLATALTRLASSALNLNLNHQQTSSTIFINNESADEEEDDESLPTLSQELECGGYSRPFVVLDVIWNLAFVLVAAFVLLTTLREMPSAPLRLWIAGYALQCLLHVAFVGIDFQSTLLFYDDDDFAAEDRLHFCSLPSHRSFIKKLESINTVVSSVWWAFGFYWIVMGGQMLLQDSPRLYWLSVVFLAFDVFFMVFCIVVACIVFFVLFCCFPILATVAYAMTIGGGASENDIRTLPKYRYRQPNIEGTFKCSEKQEAGLIEQLGSNNIPELALSLEDSECCICLHSYVDGVELCTLPCNHHFHYRCIRKWLRINATCPLCKFNIIRGEMLV